MAEDSGDRRFAGAMFEGTVPANSAAVGGGGHAAVVACATMAAFYVAILYSPTLLLRLPPPSSLRDFMIRRFACAAVSSLVSVTTTALLLRRKVGGFGSVSALLCIYGIRNDHLLQAFAYPHLLTLMVYAGSLMLKSLLLMDDWKTNSKDLGLLACYARRWFDGLRTSASNILAWRNLVVAPITEELVFRACMIPLLLCEGYKIYNIVFFTPIFFSLAHLNHFMELYYQQNYRFVKAFTIVGLQLCYTVIFGWYASFLFVRTGHLLSPVVAHTLCNFMGLPVVSSSRARGATAISFLAGAVGFFCILFPLTSPELYNSSPNERSCWCGFCRWI